MRRRFARRSFTKKGPSLKHWTAATGSNVLGAGLLAENTFLVKLDYASAAAPTLSPSGVTMLRCVGNVVINPSVNTGRFIVAMGIVHIDDDEVPAAGGAFDPSLIAQLATERWLWLKVWSAKVFVTTDNMGPSNHFDFDIKQKVRLRDSGISLIVMNLAGSPGNVEYAFMSRTLIIGDTN